MHSRTFVAPGIPQLLLLCLSLLMATGCASTTGERHSGGGHCANCGK